MTDSVEVVDISDDDDASRTTHHVATAHAKKRKLEGEVLAKVEWTDDDDDYEGFKKRRKAQGKKRGQKAKGKRPTSNRHPLKKELTIPADRFNHDRSSADDDPSLESMPDYLRERRQGFKKSCEALQELGLRLPPDETDLYFSDDEKLAVLEERPHFDGRSGVKPCQEYADLFMPHSAGLIPASIAQYLRDYQIEGVKFLHHLFVYQNGGILGDDMGLGKTVQVAAFLTAVFGKKGDQRDAKRMRKFRRNFPDRWYPRALIICPGSLTQNWLQELNRWGWWQADLFLGRDKDQVLDAARSGRLEVMITTYATYKNFRDEINRTPWDVVVADECHAIKEGTAEVTKAMNQVNSLCRIGLTGTAIQNKYEELWTLLNWTNPGQFGSLSEWKQRICKPLTIGQSHDATEEQLRDSRRTAEKLSKNLLPRFFLRRLKTLIADQLPKKSDRVIFCPLSDTQHNAYKAFIASPLVQFVISAYSPCPCGSKKKAGWCCYERNEEGESWRSLVFPLIMSLQKMSNHLTLLIPSTNDSTDKQDRDLRYLQAAVPEKWKTMYQERDSLLALANPEFCGKWAILKKLLRAWHRDGDKVLVFSHSVRLLRILQLLFNHTSYSVSYLDGSLSYEERQATVDDFNSDSHQFVFLVSTKAGGVGLNITSANKVVIMDPHWNPSYDLQAQDRAYRIGQTRDVTVFRLISAGTIEEITYARQIYKQQQANIGYTASNERRYFKGVQQDSERKGEIFGIENLLGYRGEQVVMQEIFNKTNVAEAKIGVRMMEIDMKAVVEDNKDNAWVKKEDGNDDSLMAWDETLSTPKSEETSKPLNDIQAILASAGVRYSHENSEVVGSSKVEEYLSRKAQQEQEEGGDSVLRNRAVFDDNYQGPGLISFNFRYNPPQEVMQRQFCTMASTFGFKDVTKFALTVEGWTQDERRDCLVKFYRKRMDRMRKLQDTIEMGLGEEKRHIKEERLGDSSLPTNTEPLIKSGELGGAKSVSTPTRQTAANRDEDAARSPTSTASEAESVKKEERSEKKQDRTSLHSIWLSDDDDEL
jgi:DNA excision repair protein ERCC-6-like 2